MTAIYYFSTIIIILLEMSWIINPISKTKASQKFSILQKTFKNKEWSDYSEEYKTQIKGKLMNLWVVIWMFVGLFTFQWVGFLCILLLNFAIVGPISKVVRYSYVYTILHWINSIIGFLFGIFVVVNHYHLKIDLTELIYKLF